MAFAQPIPRPFNERGIWNYAPAESGVFGITNSREWVYVGASADIRATLLQLENGGDAQLSGALATGFVFEACDSELRNGRQEQLQAEYNPVSQRRRTLVHGTRVRMGRFV
jgi:hypothetical protein